MNVLYWRTVVALTLAATINIYGQWEWQNPRPQGNRLTGIHVFANGEILASGSNGTLVRSSDGGQSWQVEHYVLGPESHEFANMLFVSENAGWATERDYRDVYYSSDRGVTWVERTPTPFGIKGLFAFDGQMLWGAGISHAIARSIDGGISWTSHEVTPTHQFNGGGIFFLDHNQGWVVGGSGISNPDDQGRVYKTTDGGQTWNLQFISSEEGTALGEVFFWDENTGWAAGTDAVIFATFDGGQSWAKQHHLPNTNFAILDLHFFDAYNGIAAGTDGLLLTTSNGGLTWEERNSTTESWIRDITVVNNSEIWGCGEFGLLIKSDNGGNAWSSISHAATTAYLNCLAFSDELTGWAGGGEDGLFYKTEDGGRNWFAADSGEHPVTLIEFIDPDNGYRIEWYGQTYRTRDGGDTWELTDVLGRNGLYLNGCFVDTSTGWLTWNYLADGYVKRTIDAGKSWEIQLQTPNDWIFGIDFISPTTGWIAGQEGNIFKTVDGGNTWTAQSSGTTETLYQIDFTDSSTGWIAGAWGTLLKTVDGGNTWIHVSIPFTTTLQELLFFDANSGWIFGNDGVGRTFDGGQTWETFDMPHGAGWLYSAAYFHNMNTGWLVGGGGHIIKFDGTATPIGEGRQSASVPSGIRLYQNYPNPFNPDTNIEFLLPKASTVTLEIFDAVGRHIDTPYQSSLLPAGVHQYTWNGTDKGGDPAASGVYFYRLLAGTQFEIRKMILMR